MLEEDARPTEEIDVAAMWSPPALPDLRRGDWSSQQQQQQQG